MRLAQIIVLSVVALALAALPAGRAHTAGVKATDVVASALTLDCGGHYPQPPDHTSKAPSDCAAMAGCASQCFNSSTTLVFAAIFPPAATTRALTLADAGAVSQIGSLPFRPPRI